jgi:hypothetical protein
VASLKLADLLGEREVQAVEHAIAMPAHEPAVHGAARRQVPGQSPPLAAWAQDVQNGIEDLAQALRGWPGPRSTAQKRSHQVPFGIRQVARVAQTWASVETSVLWGPHRRLRKSAPTSESQVIARIQISLGQALKLAGERIKILTTTFNLACAEMQEARTSLSPSDTARLEAQTAELQRKNEALSLQVKQIVDELNQQASAVDMSLLDWAAQSLRNAHPQEGPTAQD